MEIMNENNFLILDNNCYTCKHRKDKKCSVLNIEPYIYFICDHYRRKNSGAFRRKRRKAKKIFAERLKD